ncbi:hypothetical protein ACFGYY_06500 [Pasteurella multocida]
MLIYYRKGDTKNYQVFPEPNNPSDYIIVEVEDESELDSKELVKNGDGYVLVNKRPSPNHIWDGAIWVLDDGMLQEHLASLKSAKLAKINHAAQEYVDGIAKTYETPEFERDTWLTQRAEAMAWKQDPSAPTPTLDRIAMNRGVDPILLKEKAYQKSMLFTMLSDTIAGQRQKLEDLLMASKSIEEIEQINIQFNFSPEVTHA